MDQIEQSSSQIGQIVSLIDSIAFQTNLLALNAGVEAARAGESGKGFAVVANEVRALAQRSADAAKDIKELIGHSSAQVADGARLVRETGGSLQEIVGQISSISTIIEAIATGAQDQADSVGEVNKAVSEIERMTQHNAAMVEESNAASRRLFTEAEGLVEIVARHHKDTNVSGPSHGATAATPSYRAPLSRAA